MDNNHKNCLLVRDHLRMLSIGGKIPLSCKIPPTIDEYWDTTLTGEARTEWRKAKSKGYKLEKVVQTPHKEMLEILNSWEEKQGRKINNRYNTITFSNIDIKDKWPINTYEQWCPNHNLSLYVLKNTDDKVVAYLELLKSDKYALVHATMGHKEFIKDGIMKFMFIEVAKRLIGTIDFFLYGDTGSLKDERHHFHKDMNILKPLTYTTKEDRPVIVLDFDDLEVTKPGLEEIVALKEHIPNLKVSLFTIPIPAALLEKKITPKEYQQWAKWVAKQDWIEICPHGVTHQGFEMKYFPSKRRRLIDYDTANLYLDTIEKTFTELELPFKKIFKSPYWESSPHVIRALWDRGYTVGVDRNQPEPYGGPIYKYNYSIEEEMPDFQLLKAHGHMYPPSSNAIQYTFQNILDWPTDVEYRFISEVLL